MCPAGYALALTLQAWSFSVGDWVDVNLCFNDSEQRGKVMFERREVDIYQAVVKNKSFWVIDEGGKSEDRRGTGNNRKNR